MKLKFTKSITTTSRVSVRSRNESEREGERVGQRVQMREGRWASRARGSKGARGRGRGRVHGGEIVGERLETG